MSVKATINPSYRRWNLGLVTLALIGFGLYCVYDATVKYPEQKHIYDTRQETKEDFPETYPQEWAKLAAANGWDEEPKKRTSNDILTQWVMAGLTLPFGLIYGVYYIRSFSRHVTMDEQGLTTGSGDTAPWTTIQSLDDTRWKAKGIAVLQYATDNGDERKITLDDWKFEAQPTRAIHKAVIAYLQGRESNEQPEWPDDVHELTKHAHALGRQQAASAPE